MRKRRERVNEKGTATEREKRGEKQREERVREGVNGKGKREPENRGEKRKGRRNNKGENE